MLRLVLPIGIILLAVAGWFGYSAFFGGEKSSSKIRIAILPFDNSTPVDSTKDWPILLQKIFEGRMAGYSNFAVAEPFSLNTFLKSDAGGEMIANVSQKIENVGSLNFDYLLTGSLSFAGGAYRLSVRLIDTHSRSIPCSLDKRFNFDQDLLALSGEMSRDVADYLGIKRGPQDVKNALGVWMPYRFKNIRAVKAFVLAYDDVYNGRSGSETLLREAIRLDPSFISPRIWLAAHLWKNIGDTAEARKQMNALKSLLDDATPFEQIMIQWLDAFADDNSLRQQSLLRQALLYSPENNILLFHLSRISYMLRDYAQAESFILVAIKNNWHFYDAYNLLAMLQAGQKRFDDARATLETCLNFNPSVNRLYPMLVAMYYKTKLTDKAEKAEKEYVDRSMRNGLSSASAHVDLGEYLYWYEQYEPALRHLQLACKDDPGNVRAVFVLAETYAGIDNYPDALKACRSALKIDSTRMDVYMLMAQIFAKTKNVQEERRIYQLMLQKDSTSALAQDARTKLQTLGQ